MVKKAKSSKSKKSKRPKGKSLSQVLREKEEARAKLDRQLAEEAEEQAEDGDLDEEPLPAEADDDDGYEEDDDLYEDEDGELEDDLASLEDPEGSAALTREDEEDEEEDDEYEDEDEDDDEYDEAAAQMGHQRYVMAGFFGLWLVVAYVLGRAFEMLWSSLASRDWFVENLPLLAAVPHEGELLSRETISLVLGGIVGGIIVLRYYLKPDIRTWADEVAEELSHVKWPTKKEIGNHTVVVIIASAIITLYLWLLDQFWTFATNLIYQSGA